MLSYPVISLIQLFYLKANALALFHPAALQLLASKVSAVNGDARRALHIARRTVEKESQRMFDMEKDQLTLGDIQMPPKVLSQIHLLSGVYKNIK